MSTALNMISRMNWDRIVRRKRTYELDVESTSLLRVGVIPVSNSSSLSIHRQIIDALTDTFQATGENTPIEIFDIDPDISVSDIGNVSDRASSLIHKIDEYMGRYKLDVVLFGEFFDHNQSVKLQARINSADPKAYFASRFSTTDLTTFFIEAPKVCAKAIFAELISKGVGLIGGSRENMRIFGRAFLSQIDPVIGHLNEISISYEEQDKIYLCYASALAMIADISGDLELRKVAISVLEQISNNAKENSESQLVSRMNLATSRGQTAQRTGSKEGLIEQSDALLSLNKYLSIEIYPAHFSIANSNRAACLRRLASITKDETYAYQAALAAQAALETRDSQDTHQRSEVLTNYGNVFGTLYDEFHVEEAFEIALAALRESRDLRSVGDYDWLMSSMNLAILYRVHAKRNQDIDSAIESKNIYESMIVFAEEKFSASNRAKFLDNYANAINQIYTIEDGVHLLYKSVALSKEALSLAQEAGEEFIQSTIKSNLGDRLIECYRIDLDKIHLTEGIQNLTEAALYFESIGAAERARAERAAIRRAISG